MPFGGSRASLVAVRVLYSPLVRCLLDRQRRISHIRGTQLRTDSPNLRDASVEMSATDIPSRNSVTDRDQRRERHRRRSGGRRIAPGRHHDRRDARDRRTPFADDSDVEPQSDSDSPLGAHSADDGGDKRRQLRAVREKRERLLSRDDSCVDVGSRGLSRDDSYVGIPGLEEGTVLRRTFTSSSRRIGRSSSRQPSRDRRVASSRSLASSRRPRRDLRSSRSTHSHYHHRRAQTQGGNIAHIRDNRTSSLRSHIRDKRTTSLRTRPVYESRRSRRKYSGSFSDQSEISSDFDSSERDHELDSDSRSLRAHRRRVEFGRRRRRRDDDAIDDDDSD